MSLFVLLLLPFAGALVVGMLPRGARNTASAVAATVALVIVIWLCCLFPQVRHDGALRASIPWLPYPGMDLSVRVDGFAWLFAMLIAAIGLMVAVYARYYLDRDDPVARFYAFLLAFMGSMLGVALSGQLMQLALFWEITGLFSFLLIGYWHHKAEARRGARVALYVTGAGGFALLAGVLLLGVTAGSFDLDTVLASGPRIRSSPYYPLIVVLVAAGALTKSAQFPFHFWLPRAMAAPTPVSAYLHSATMVKAGVFLLARLWPVLSGTDLWFWIIGGAGLVTLLLGAVFAIFQSDLKGLLAYSTVSNLGLITLLLGMNSELAAVAAVFHMLNHATFKASLFMATGIIDHETGTRDLRRLSGLWRPMPHTSALALVSCAAMAGVPLLNGFLSKEMFFAETVVRETHPWLGWVLPLLATIAGACAVVYSLRFAVDTLFGPPPTGLPREPHEPARWMRVPVELLVLVCVVVGVAPRFAVGLVLEMAARPVVGGTLPEYHLAVWHGVNLPLMMSVVAMVAGGIGYALLRRRDRRATQSPAWTRRTDGQRAFERTLLLLTAGARQLLGLVSSRRLQTQVLLILCVTLLLGFLAFEGLPLSWGDRARTPASLPFALLWFVGGACAIGAAWQAKYHRLAAMILLGGTGIVVCLGFVLMAAPDLALTQFAVESVTTVLFLLGLRWLPKRELSLAPAWPLRARARRIRDALVAIGGGLGLAALAYALMTRPAPQSISPYFLDAAVPDGGGANVVNVMLVDFRGFDTFGEIVVLGIVALTVFALLRRFRPPRESVEATSQQSAALARPDSDLHGADDTSLLAGGYLTGPSILAGVFFPVALMISMALFLRGHNEPGGGFVAGLLVATALIIEYIMLGARAVETRINLMPVRWIGLGVITAVLTGAASLVAGFPFMTTHTFHATWPVLGEVHVPSALFFDIGVFAVVVGSTVLVLLALAHQSVRVQRRRPGGE